MQAAVPLSEFLSMFARLNQDIWPLQVITLLCGAAMAIAATRNSSISDRISAAVLGSIWIFVGVAFQWIYFRPIYTPGRMFAALWIIQGVLLIVFGAFRGGLSFKASRDGYAVFGFLLIAYALVVYPALGFYLRSDLSHVASFGAFPCPVALFTIGMLMLTEDRVQKYLAIIPLFWALGGVVPVSWGVTEDIGLVVGGTVGIITLFVRDYRIRRTAPTA